MAATFQVDFAHRRTLTRVEKALSQGGHEVTSVFTDATNNLVITLDDDEYSRIVINASHWAGYVIA